MLALRLITVLLTACDIAFNPRSARDQSYCRSLGENIRTNGQKVPIIGFFKGDRFQVADGGCRVEGMRLVGLSETLALDWGKEPTAADLLMAHASIDLHKQFLPPLDRARLFRSLLDARKCTAKHLAQDLSISDSLVGRYLSLLTLPTDLQEQVNSGDLDFGKAYLLAQVPEPDRQRELAVAAKDIPRDAFAKLARKLRTERTPSSSTTVKRSRVSCPLTNGTTVVISGPEMTLLDVINVLQSALDAAKKASRENLDVKTAEKVWRDKAKAS
jgi:ParB family chromosome partitioning protein